MGTQAMATVAPIRPGITVPDQNRAEDVKTSMVANMARNYAARAYELAQTAPNSKEHLHALHMSGMSNQLPCNKLRLIVTPLGPQREWLDEAIKRANVAIAAHDHIESQWSLAYHLDGKDGGDRHLAFGLERTRARREADDAIEDALRIPITRKWDIKRKQDLAGKETWAREYRPTWQALIDADVAAYAKPRKSKGAEA
ncbi:MAG: hypothetical protein JWR80_8538 [Bradyrhizobium sp.]|nr:hypothetical protein [Bradyrhizobium sp.]